MGILIERVDYSHLIGSEALRDGVGEFNMNVTYPYIHSSFFTEEQFQADKARLETPPDSHRTFIVGAFTGYLNPVLRRLPYYYSDFIDALHQFYITIGVEPYSSFIREKHGELGISSEHATILDRLALDTSHFLTVLPNASDSAGTWKEICHATKRGTDLVCLYREENPEMEFRQRIMEASAVYGGKSNLTLVTFDNQSELFGALRVVTNELKVD